MFPALGQRQRLHHQRPVGARFVRAFAQHLPERPPAGLAGEQAQDVADAKSLFDTLENELIPLYYDKDEDGIPHRWLQWVKESIVTCAPEFSTRRMVSQYFDTMYLGLGEAALRAAA